MIDWVLRQLKYAISFCKTSCFPHIYLIMCVFIILFLFLISKSQKCLIIFWLHIKFTDFRTLIFLISSNLGAFLIQDGLKASSFKKKNIFITDFFSCENSNLHSFSHIIHTVKFTVIFLYCYKDSFAFFWLI